MGNAIIQNPVDRENHIVHGVKVLGFTSANGRIYDFAAVKEAIQKYEKAPVNKDHNMEEPSFSDRLGWLENVTLEKDGLYADFHYNPHADGIESFLWFAEHNGLGDVGFSHLVSGKYSVDPDGTERITRIDKVKSVDLVANPATTKTIFESEKLDQGNNETLSRGIEKNNDGTYTALTYSASKTFRTLAGAKKWMNERPRPMKESDEPIYFGSSVTKTFYDKMKKLAASGSEEGKRQVAWIEDGIKKNEKERQIQKDLWAKHLKNKKSEQEDKPMGKKIAKEAGNAANKVKKNAIDRSRGDKEIIAMLSHPDSKYSSLTQRDLKDFDNPKIKTSLGRRQNYDGSLIGARGQIEKAKAKAKAKAKEQEDDSVDEAENVYLNYNRFKDQYLKMYPKTAEEIIKKAFETYKSWAGKLDVESKEQEDDDVEEAYKDQPSDPYDLGLFMKKQGVKKPDNPFGDGIGTGKTFNSDQFDRGFSGRPRAVFKTKPGEQEDDNVGEARAEPKPTLTNQSYWNKSYEALKSIGKQAREASARMLKMGDMKNAMRYDEQNADAATVLGYRERNPKDPIKPEQEGDDEMDKEKLMEEENPMQQEEAEQDPMMEEEEDVYAKIKEVCEGEGSDEEKSKQVLEMLGLSGGMSEAEDDEEMKEDDDEETKEQDSEVLENDDEEMKEDDEEMKEDDDEDPRKESKSELKSLRKWKSEKLKQEKIVNLIKESNLEPTKVFVKQLSAIDSKLWGEAIRDRRKVALTRAAVKPISSGSQSRSESSYKQFLESVLGK